MPLPPPAPRHLVHNRIVRCDGWIREDGLWEIEGRMTDSKSYSFTGKQRGVVAAGAPVHDLWLRLTLGDDFVIRAAMAVTDAAPYRVCGDIVPSYQHLVGLRVGAGFLEAVRDRFRGVRGCTHLTELLGPMATTAYQTIFASQEHGKGLIGRKVPPEPEEGAPRRRPGHLGLCHALKLDGPVVEELWPEFAVSRRPA